MGAGDRPAGGHGCRAAAGRSGGARARRLPYAAPDRPAAAQEAGRALVFGEATAGSVLIAQDTDLPDGGRLTLSRADFRTSGGIRLEKRGVVPDVVVATTAADLGAGRDPVMEVAIEALSKDRLTVRAQASPSLPF
ncbi:MAG: hypothetical protein DCE92_11885 [Alphaproteobacteria bacterium]|nr:MAG: hypothetical protein DCE92_11885 [Alphaproteobacteria bacterium]